MPAVFLFHPARVNLSPVGKALLWLAVPGCNLPHGAPRVAVPELGTEGLQVPAAAALKTQAVVGSTREAGRL